MKRLMVTLNDCITLSYPRRWREVWRTGWKRHTDGLGRPCWIRFKQYAAGSDLIRDAVDEIERLRADNAALSRRAEKAEKDVQWMVQKAADNDLAGYREMGSQLAAIETERDELRAEVERLQGLVGHLEEQVGSQYDEAVTTAVPRQAR